MKGLEDFFQVLRDNICADCDGWGNNDEDLGGWDVVAKAFSASPVKARHQVVTTIFHYWMVKDHYRCMHSDTDKPWWPSDNDGFSETPDGCATTVAGLFWALAGSSAEERAQCVTSILGGKPLPDAVGGAAEYGNEWVGAGCEVFFLFAGRENDITPTLEVLAELWTNHGWSTNALARVVTKYGNWEGGPAELSDVVFFETERDACVQLSELCPGLDPLDIAFEMLAWTRKKAEAEYVERYY